MPRFRRNVAESNTFVYKTSQNELVAYIADTNSTTLLMNNSTFVSDKQRTDVTLVSYN